jgi:hypothetical protein
MPAGDLCGSSAPYACITTGGCYADSSSAQQGCPNDWCYFGPCVITSLRPSRTIVFVNQCDEAFPVYQNNTTMIVTKEQFPAKGGLYVYTFDLTAVPSSWGVTYYQTGPTGAGINFAALPTDQDLSNSTLFEPNFGAYDGQSDVYDLSAIPPSSCAGHMQTSDNDYGYADHLPYIDPSNTKLNWACLVNPTTGQLSCGDGLGWYLCPAVTGTSTVAATVQPPTAQNGGSGNITYGCGVSGTTCCASTSPTGTCDTTSVTSCCPNVCAVTGTEDPTAPSVRNLVHNCAYQQSLTVAQNNGMKTKIGTTPRQTGFWKAMLVEPVWPAGQQPGAGCLTIYCGAGGTEKDPTFETMAQTCAAGYLWPYDDAAATVTCNGAPDYKVTFCPTPGAMK